MHRQTLRNSSKMAFLFFVLLWMVLIFHSLRMLFPKVWGVSLISISLSYLYAVTDEYHQSFIFDRTPLFADVLLETGGAMLGIILFISLSQLVSILYRKFFSKNERRVR